MMFFGRNNRKGRNSVADSHFATTYFEPIAICYFFEWRSYNLLKIGYRIHCEVGLHVLSRFFIFYLFKSHRYANKRSRDED